MTHTLILPDYHIALLNTAMRKNYRTAMHVAKECKQFVTTYRLLQKIPKATGARRVQFIVTFPDNKTRPDPDSILKLGLDALKTCGLLVDDSYEMCEFLPPIYYLGPKRTRIVLTDIETKIVGPEPEETPATGPPADIPA